MPVSEPKLLPNTSVLANVLFAVEGLVILSVMTRLVGRWLSRTRWGSDDIVALPAFALGFSVGILFHILCSWGLGHPWSKTEESHKGMGQLLLVHEITYTVGFNLTKISALLFYRRVFISKSMQITINICIGALAVFMIGNTLASFLICRPLSTIWTSRWCGDRTPIYRAGSVFAIISEIFMLALPLPQIWKLKMQRSTKIALTLVFSVGVSVIVASCYRLMALTRISEQGDLTISATDALFASALEVNLTLICSNMPMTHSLWVRYHKRHHHKSDGRKKQQHDVSHSISDMISNNNNNYNEDDSSDSSTINRRKMLYPLSSDSNTKNNKRNSGWPPAPVVMDPDEFRKSQTRSTILDPWETTTTFHNTEKTRRSMVASCRPSAEVVTTVEGSYSGGGGGGGNGNKRDSWSDFLPSGQRRGPLREIHVQTTLDIHLEHY